MVPEDKIKEFVEKMRASAGSNLESVILYGSAASGDYRPEFSNVNLFCVLRDASYAKLRALAGVVKWWERQKQPPPLFMTREELERSTDVFTIELIDMKQHYRVLWGGDVVERLQIPMRPHRVQVEYELREKLILLRQQLLLAGDDERRIRELLVRSVTSFATLFRHALIALGESAQVAKRDSVEQLAARLGLDASPIKQAFDVRQHKPDSKKLHAAEIVGRYLETVEKVTAAVDQIIGADAPGRT
jgi:predicted nucleotidyltransferase